MNCKFVKIALFASLAGAMAVSCGSKSDGPLLKGHIEGLGPDSKPYISYSFYGDIQSTKYDGLELDSLGNFEFNPELPEGVDFMEVEIGGITDTPYGAYVERGNTSEMTITVPAEGDAVIAFGGDNADISAAVNTAADAYNFMKFFAMDPSEQKTDDEYDAMLEEGNAKVVKAVEAIGDSDKREYYSKLFDLQYMSRKMTNLSSRMHHEGSYSSRADLLANPEYKAMFDRIDMNDPMMAKANLTILWLNFKAPYDYNWENPNVDSLIMNLDFIDKNVTEPLNRRSALNNAPFFYIEKSKPSKAEAQRYMDAFSKVAADYPEIVDHYQSAVDGIVELNEGDRMPYYPTLTDPEGKQVKLEDLMGKVTYIDVWATWCGPCCREIPYMEKLVERFKGNDKVQFISISVDQDLDAWHKKLDNDKPEWPQYVLSADEQKAFMSAMGIQGIPRFILLDAEGRFVQNDAKRPSDDNIDEVIKAAIK